MITHADFKKLDIRIGQVVSAQKVEGTDKLLKLEVDLGTEKRQIVAGMAEFFEPEYLVGQQVPVLANLEARDFRGVRSHGMILAADVGGKPVLLHPSQPVPSGSTIR